MLLNPITTQKIANLKKFSHTPLKHRFCLVICCLLSCRHFGAAGIKFSLNPTTAQKMTNLQKTVFWYISSVLHFGNSTIHISLNPLLNKRCSICKILLHAYESSFLPRFWRFASQRHFAALTLRFTLNPNCGPKDGQFIKHCQTPLNHRFQLDLWCLPSE